MYRRPGRKIPKRVWDNLLKNKKNEQTWIIGGDFNSHNVTWNCRNTDINGNNLNKAMEEKGMYVINEDTESWMGDYRRKPANLDLIFASEDIRGIIKYE